MDEREPTRNDAFLTVGDAARRIGCSQWTIYAAIRRGALRAARINERGDLRIRESWLTGYIDARSVVVAPAYGAAPRG
jgi:excisionase family DNA binding protein